MKYGLYIEKNMLKSKYGGIGYNIADSIMPEYMVICRYIYSIKSKSSDNAKEFCYRMAPHSYILVGYHLAKVFWHDEFIGDDDISEIEMGLIPTHDLLDILVEYRKQLCKDPKYYKYIKWEIIFRRIWIFLDDNSNIYESYYQSSDWIDITLHLGVEKEINHRMKVKNYRVVVEYNQIVVKKNRQYENDSPTIFPVDKLDQFFVWLREDIIEWDKVIKEFYYEDKKLLFRDYVPKL